MKIVDSELRFTLAEYKTNIYDTCSKLNLYLTVLRVISWFILVGWFILSANEVSTTFAVYMTAYFWLIFTTYTRVKNTTDCFQDYAILLNHIQDFDYSESSVEYFNEIVTGAKDLLQS